MSLSAAEKNELKREIEHQLRELKASLLLSSASGEPVKLDQSSTGRVSRIDAIQQQKMAQAASSRDSLRLKALMRSLQMLDEEDFGECQMCGEVIAFARLKIRPESKFCVACQQAGE